MAQEEAKDPDITWKALGGMMKKEVDKLKPLFKAGKRMGNRKWTMFWLR